MDEQNRNLLLATGLSLLVILIWFLLFPPPEPEETPEATTTSTSTTETGTTPSEPVGDTAIVPSTADQPASWPLGQPGNLPSFLGIYQVGARPHARPPVGWLVDGGRGKGQVPMMITNSMNSLDSLAS